MSTKHEANSVQFTIDLGDETPRAPAVDRAIPQLSAGARLRLARRGRGLSQWELGRRMRRTRHTVARWERYGFPAWHLWPLAEILGVSRRWLVCGIEPARVPGDGTLPPGLAWEARLELAAWPGTRHGSLTTLSCDEDRAVRKVARETLARLGLVVPPPRRYLRPRRRRRPVAEPQRERTTQTPILLYVDDSYRRASDGAFVLLGRTYSPFIVPGMRVVYAWISRAVTWEEIDAVEYLGEQRGIHQVALTLARDDPKSAEFLEAQDIRDEYMVVVRPGDEVDLSVCPIGPTTPRHVSIDLRGLGGGEAGAS